MFLKIDQLNIITIDQNKLHLIKHKLHIIKQKLHIIKHEALILLLKVYN